MYFNRGDEMIKFTIKYIPYVIAFIIGWLIYDYFDFFLSATPYLCCAAVGFLGGLFWNGRGVHNEIDGYVRKLTEAQTENGQLKIDLESKTYVAEKLLQENADLKNRMWLLDHPAPKEMDIF